MHKMKDAKIVSTELLVDSFKKVVLEKIESEPGGKTYDWIYMDTPKSIVVVALTPKHEIVLVKLYRHNIRKDVYELPAGAVDGKETEIQAAKRELLEETGYTADTFIALGEYYALPSETNRYEHFYLALDAVKTAEPILDDLIEKFFDMSITTVPFDEVTTIAGAQKHGITGVTSLLGIQLAKAHLDSV
jgi:ADP-ribose pyrophosphatase